MDRTLTDITWEDYIAQPPSYVNGKELTNIKCPDCGRYIYRDHSAILTTYPPQFYYLCECGWHGIGH